MKELGRRRGPARRPFRCSYENHALLFLWLLPVGPCPPFLFLLKWPGTERKRKPRLCSRLCCQECVCSRSRSKNKTGQSLGRPARAAEHGNKGARPQQLQQQQQQAMEWQAGWELQEWLHPLKDGKLRLREDVLYLSSGDLGLLRACPHCCLTLIALLLMMEL